MAGIIVLLAVFLASLFAFIFTIIYLVKLVIVGMRSIEEPQSDIGTAVVQRETGSAAVDSTGISTGVGIAPDQAEFADMTPSQTPGSVEGKFGAPISSIVEGNKMDSIGAVASSIGVGMMVPATASMAGESAGEVPPAVKPDENAFPRYEIDTPDSLLELEQTIEKYVRERNQSSTNEQPRPVPTEETSGQAGEVRSVEEEAPSSASTSKREVLSAELRGIIDSIMSGGPSSAKGDGEPTVEPEEGDRSSP
ncbi:MAG: hypothetical protein M1548_07415 [Actinobacteria bacterium]|nr:hypothetical protein [Actinomycetota bacterium]